MEKSSTAQGDWSRSVVKSVTGIVVVVCLVRVWVIVTGIPVVPLGDTWVTPEAMPQILNLQLGSGTTPTDITALPVWLRVLSATSLVALAVMVVIVFRAVDLLARRSAEGRPFADDVIRRLRDGSLWLLWLVLGRLLIDAATIAALHRWFSTKPDEHGGGALGTDLPALSLPMLVAAVVADLLARAFERGRQLTEDTDGLV